ncbi:MAG: signal peptidase I [Verrucomicrobiota bacterium]
MPIKRNRFLAGLLALLIPGLGALYNARVKKALLYLFGFPVLGVLAAATAYLQSWLWLSIAMYVTLVTFRILVVVEQIRLAGRGVESLSQFNRWFYYFGFFLLASFIDYGVTTALKMAFQGRAGIVFQIPTASMEPTVDRRDIVIIDKQVRELKRGDIIVFWAPTPTSNGFSPKPKPTLYMKRVIGLPGDTIDLSNGRPIINGQEPPEPYVTQQATMSLFEEMFQNEPRAFNKFIEKFFPPEPISVPKGTYFVMGDNRMESYDSRHFGPIPEEVIEGTIAFHFGSGDYHK